MSEGGDNDQSTLSHRIGRLAVAATLVLGALTLRSSPSLGVQFCNPTPITFTPPPSPTPAVLTFQPYPSMINVAALSGTITDVNVTLNDFTYTFPEDVDVLLVAPDGSTTLVVTSDIGGDNDGVAESATDVNLTFDDQAGSNAPTDSQLSSGTFRPTDDDNDLDDFVPGNADSFHAPAPAPSASTALSVFSGLMPNGTWSLYVVDDEPGPTISGDFGGGWCIDILTTGPTTSTTSTTTTSTTTTSTTTTSTTTTSTTTTSTTTTSTTTTSTTTTTLLPTTTTTINPLICNGRTATIVGTSGNDTIVGTSGPDVVVGVGGDDQIAGIGGDDVICGGEGNDRISGGDGNDTILGGPGNDDLAGGSSNDTLRGEAGNDRLSGGDGTDSCTADGTDLLATCEI